MTDSKKRGRKGELSVVIDPLLLEGGRRVNQIAELVVSQFGDKYKKAQVVNNIRSRMNVLVSKGYTIERDATERRILRLVAPAAQVVEEPVSPANV